MSTALNVAFFHTPEGGTVLSSIERIRRQQQRPNRLWILGAMAAIVLNL